MQSNGIEGYAANGKSEAGENAVGDDISGLCQSTHTFQRRKHGAVGNSRLGQHVRNRLADAYSEFAEEIGHMKTAFYCPQVNNAERVNRVVVTCIRALLDGDHREWDEKLPAITVAINEVTGVYPHEANFGRNLLLHTVLYTQQELNTPEYPTEAQDLRLSAIHRTQKLIIDRIKNSHQRAKQRYKLCARSVAFKVRDFLAAIVRTLLKGGPNQQDIQTKRKCGSYANWCLSTK